MGPAEPQFLQVLDGDCSAYLAGIVRVEGHGGKGEAPEVYCVTPALVCAPCIS